ncbi:immunity 26/phosphotriesterase HocA family protein [Microlunatus sp. Y2014]|uniref:immunity 26/phosphotriesterase HocA family protein n=1 Tax=Microlunatus sp. Y2014 TaxID=3418488 RepID=UPI003DA73BF1
MAEVQTNLRVLQASRKKVRPGDVFAMQLPDRTYLFGRVIGADLEPPRAPMPKAYLIYVYQGCSQTIEPDLDALVPDRLLLPPVFINRMPWTKGYFQTVANRDLAEGDLLPQHCFWDALRACYIDEQQNVLPREVPPCGDWGLSSYRWLDDQISDALGIPRVPEA